MRIGLWRFLQETLVKPPGAEGDLRRERHGLQPHRGLRGGADAGGTSLATATSSGPCTRSRTSARPSPTLGNEGITGKVLRGPGSARRPRRMRRSTAGRSRYRNVADWVLDEELVRQDEVGEIVGSLTVEVDDVVMRAVQQEPSDEIFRRGRDRRPAYLTAKARRVMAIPIRSDPPVCRTASDLETRNDEHPRPQRRGDVDGCRDPRLVPREVPRDDSRRYAATPLALSRAHSASGAALA